MPSGMQCYVTSKYVALCGQAEPEAQINHCFMLLQTMERPGAAGLLGGTRASLIPRPGERLHPPKIRWLGEHDGLYQVERQKHRMSSDG